MGFSIQVEGAQEFYVNLSRYHFQVRKILLSFIFFRLVEKFEKTISFLTFHIDHTIECQNIENSPLTLDLPPNSLKIIKIAVRLLRRTNRRVNHLKMLYQIEASR